MNQIKLNMIAMVLVLLGAVNMGVLGATNKNLVNQLVPCPYSRIVHMVIGLAALFLAKRDVFLPFLGQTAIPCSLFEAKVPANPTHQVEVRVTPNTKVVYWAAEKDDNPDQVAGAWAAYGKVTNSGVTMSDEFGRATFKIRYPQDYSVRDGNKHLSPHVHYRECDSNLMMGPVQTVNV